MADVRSPTLNQFLGVLDKESLKRAKEQEVNKKRYFDALHQLTAKDNLEEYLKKTKKPKREDIIRWIKYVESMKSLGDITDNKTTAKILSVLTKHHKNHRASYLMQALDEGVKIEKSEDELNLGMQVLEQIADDIEEIVHEGIDKDEMIAELKELTEEEIENYKILVETLLGIPHNESEEHKRHEHLVELHAVMMAFLIAEELDDIEEENALERKQEPLIEKAESDSFDEEAETEAEITAMMRREAAEDEEDIVSELLHHYEEQQHELQQDLREILEITDDEMTDEYLGLFIASVDELISFHREAADESLSQAELVRQYYVNEQVEKMPAGKKAMIRLRDRSDTRFTDTIRLTLATEQDKLIVKGLVQLKTQASLTPFQRCALLEFGDAERPIQLHLENRVSYRSFNMALKSLQEMPPQHQEMVMKVTNELKAMWGKTGLVTDLTYDILKNKLTELSKIMKPVGQKAARLSVTSLWTTERGKIGEIIKQINTQHALEKKRHKKQLKTTVRMSAQFNFASQHKSRLPRTNVVSKSRNHKHPKTTR